MPGPVFLEGDRLTLRLVEQDDYEFLARYFNDPSVRHQVGGGLRNPWPEDTIEAFVDNEDIVHFLACRNGTPVGWVLLKEVDLEASNAELGYFIHPDEAGNGYATEAADLSLAHAFDELGLHKVYARVQEDNEASIRVLEKLGFEQEGVFRDHDYWLGEYIDMHRFGLLASEW